MWSEEGEGGATFQDHSTIDQILDNQERCWSSILDTISTYLVSFCPKIRNYNHLDSSHFVSLEIRALILHIAGAAWILEEWEYVLVDFLFEKKSPLLLGVCLEKEAKLRMARGILVWWVPRSRWNVFVMRPGKFSGDLSRTHVVWPVEMSHRSFSFSKRKMSEKFEPKTWEEMFDNCWNFERNVSSQSTIGKAL